jgi:uncharacterized UPF0160 family protein
MEKLVTHSGPFHPDDVFAVAVIQLLYGVEGVEIVRTRDTEIITEADIVVDVGMEYDPKQGRFDHHQDDGPVRDNQVPYAAFGLVWKEFGASIAGSPAVAAKIEERLCQPIDAADNGILLYSLNEYEIAPVEIQSVIFSFHPLQDQTDILYDTAFSEAVDFARRYLARYIEKTRLRVAEKERALAIYEKALDKRIIIADEHVSTSHLIDFPEPQVVVSPALDGRWKARVLPVTKDEPFSARVLFPESWGGKEGQELEDVSGIENLAFCHKGRHLVFTETKEAAVAAAKHAK